MDGTMFFTLQEVNCTPEFMQATYQGSDSLRLTVYCMTALQAVILLIGAMLNSTCLATLLRYPLSSEVNAHFVSFSLSDTAFLLCNLLDTVSHCIENSGPHGPGPVRYIVYVHPIAWTVRSVTYTVHCWQTVLLSVLKCLRVSRPLSSMPEGRLNLLIASVWLYSLGSSIPPILLFQAFVSVLLADCPGEGYRIAGSGYYSYFASNRTANPEVSVDTIPPTFVAINSSLLPACVCLVCSFIIVRRLRIRSGTGGSRRNSSIGSGSSIANLSTQPAAHHHHHHRHFEATVARQGREATRAVLVSVNSFLLFQVPMVMWTLVDRWFWRALRPATFSLLVVISNTISQAFFAIDLSVCLHSNRRFRANFRRFLLPFSKRDSPGAYRSPQHYLHHQTPHDIRAAGLSDARREHCASCAHSETLRTTSLTTPSASVHNEGLQVADQSK